MATTGWQRKPDGLHDAIASVRMRLDESEYISLSFPGLLRISVGMASPLTHLTKKDVVSEWQIVYILISQF